jgi:hypothetical protein
MTNLYQLLSVSSVANTAEIQAAYNRERARIMADEPAGEVQTAEQLAVLDEAYATLVDPARRAAYDQSIGSSSMGTALTAAVQSTTIIVPPTPPTPILKQQCPHCGALNPIQATMCEQCGQQVSRPCPNCGQPTILGQTVCSRCHTYIPEYDQRRFAEAVKVGQQTQQVRQESEIRLEALEASHKASSRQGMIFWIAVVGACIGITMLLALLNNSRSLIR